MMEVWTAFTLGFLGSFHCIGMCGPIALALPNTRKGKMLFMLNRFTYNLGRITTYALIGLLFGLLGKGFALAGAQKTLSIGMGLAIILFAFLPAVFNRHFNPSGLAGRLVGKIKKQMQFQFRRNSFLSVYTIGTLNGLLPCGLVYLAAAAAITTSSPIEGALYMASFGIGTLPAMLVLAYAGNFLHIHWRNSIKRVMPFVTVAVGLLLIIRGMELNIPFISPILGFIEKGMTMCGVK